MLWFVLIEKALRLLHVDFLCKIPLKNTLLTSSWRGFHPLHAAKLDITLTEVELTAGLEVS